MISTIIVGIISSLLPSFHPTLLRFSSNWDAAIVYGIYSSLFVLPSVYLGAFSAVTAYAYIIAHRMAVRGRGYRAILLYALGAVAGVVLAFVYIPLSTLLSIRLPHTVIFALLLIVSVLTVVRSRNVFVAIMLTLFYSLFGYLVLNQYPLSNPLPVAISGLFGASTIAVSLLSKERIPLGRTGSIEVMPLLRGTVFGLLVAFLVSYFPAISLSVAAFLVQPVLSVRDEEMMVASGSAASASLLLTAVGRNYGLVRSSFAAAIAPPVDNKVLLLAAFGVLVGAGLALFLAPVLYRVYSSRITKYLSLVFIVAISLFFFGLESLPLIIVSTVAGALTHIFGVEKRIAMFVLIFQTMLYYAPM